MIVVQDSALDSDSLSIRRAESQLDDYVCSVGQPSREYCVGREREGPAYIDPQLVKRVISHQRGRPVKALGSSLSP